MAEPIQPVFTIDKLYVKDLSVEIPNAPQIFLEREQPKVDLQIQNGANQISDGVYEAFLTATITAKIGEKTARTSFALEPWPQKMPQGRFRGSPIRAADRPEPRPRSSLSRHRRVSPALTVRPGTAVRPG